MRDRPHSPIASTAPMSVPDMSIDAIPQPSLYPVTSAPGAVAALRATVPGGEQPKQATETTARRPLELGPAPTEDALAAVQVAAQAYEVLRRSGRELRFSSDGGIMRIEVFDGTGALVRSIPPTEALALASGDSSWQA
jgi:hypothetical protein